MIKVKKKREEDGGATVASTGVGCRRGEGRLLGENEREGEGESSAAPFRAWKSKNRF